MVVMKLIHKDNNWLRPDEVEKINGKFVKKTNQEISVKAVIRINVKIKKKCH